MAVSLCTRVQWSWARPCSTVGSVLVNALLANVDARSHLLKRYPELYGKLNEYALDTDDLEFLFSALALRAGWNCPAVQQLRLLRSIRRLAHLRSDPNSGISLPHSQHA